MHAATPRIGIQTTIFSEHEVFEDCCHFYHFHIFAKKCENNEKIMSFNYKIYNFHSFLVSNTINMLIPEIHACSNPSHWYPNNYIFRT